MKTTVITDYRSLRDFLNALTDDQLKQTPQLIGSDGQKLYEAEITTVGFYENNKSGDGGYPLDFGLLQSEMESSPDYKLKEPKGTVLLFVR